MVSVIQCHWIILDEGEEMALEVEKGCFSWQGSDWAELVKSRADETDYEIENPFQLKNLSLFIAKVFFLIYLI